MMSETTKNKMNIKKVSGGVCGVKGIRASGVHCGMKADGAPDLALVVSDAPCRTAVFYTTNLLNGAHIAAFKSRLGKSKGLCSAVLVNSRIANCSTGKQGFQDTMLICDKLAALLDVPREQVVHASTGVIGRRLAVDKILGALPVAQKALSAKGGDDAAKAIMTTDAWPKSACVQVGTGADAYRIGGMAKGAGMIHPNMATMLAFVFTDADVSAKDLREVSRRVMNKTFNRISIDNDMSPNDTFAVMANGVSGVKIGAGGRPLAEFEEALYELCSKIARDMVKSGEGVTKVVEILVENARSEKDADTIARGIADSQLVKTAIFGSDPNWGRVLSAAATSGAKFDPEKARLLIDGALVYDRGKPVEAMKKIMQGKEVLIRFDAAAGKASARRWTGDLSIDYVKINADYTT